jgi:hypothetical protein
MALVRSVHKSHDYIKINHKKKNVKWIAKKNGPLKKDCQKNVLPITVLKIKISMFNAQKLIHFNCR